MSRDWDTFDHHPTCPCGEELADECICGRCPLGSMRITTPDLAPLDRDQYDEIEETT